MERWQIADRVLQACLAGADLNACLRVERARGALPPGQLADSPLDQITAPLDDLVAAGRSAEAPQSLDAHVGLSDTLSIVGTVPGIRGDVVHTVTYSKLGPAHRLIAWVRLLALSATWPERSFSALTVGRSQGTRPTIAVATIRPLGPDAASRKEAAELHLGALAELFLRGMREPLPLYLRTSAAWATAAAEGRTRPAAASGAWASDYNFDKEDKEAEHVLVLGGGLPFRSLLDRAGAPLSDEVPWAPSEATRFGVYAHRLWDGLLAHEEVVDR